MRLVVIAIIVLGLCSPVDWRETDGSSNRKDTAGANRPRVVWLADRDNGRR